MSKKAEYAYSILTMVIKINHERLNWKFHNYLQNLKKIDFFEKKTTYFYLYFFYISVYPNNSLQLDSTQQKLMKNASFFQAQREFRNFFFQMKYLLLFCLCRNSWVSSKRTGFCKIHDISRDISTIKIRLDVCVFEL